MILDGGTATELDTVVPPPESERDEPLLGDLGAAARPDAALDVHRRYVEIGCDVVSTNTWGLTDAVDLDHIGRQSTAEPLHWMDVARRGLQVGRDAIARGGRAGEVALAFSVNGDVDTPERRETMQLLTRVLEEEPPDLVLLETMTLIRAELTFSAVELMLEDGPAGVAVVPALSPGRLRRLRPALGRSGGRRLRTRRQALGGHGRGRAADQLPAARPRTGRAALAARLHRSATRRLPTQGSFLVWKRVFQAATGHGATSCSSRSSASSAPRSCSSSTA